MSALAISTVLVESSGSVTTMIRSPVSATIRPLVCFPLTTIVVNGKQYAGRIVADLGDKIVVVTDPEDSTKTIELAKAEIESETPSPISLMPVGLLKSLNDREVLDLLAYLLSRGNPLDPMFARSTASSTTAGQTDRAPQPQSGASQ